MSNNLFCSFEGNSPDEGGGPLRIIGVDPELGFAGGESQVLGLTLELLRSGHDAQLLCDPDGIAVAAGPRGQRRLPST